MISEDLPPEDVLAEIRRVYDVDVQVASPPTTTIRTPSSGAAATAGITTERNKQDRT